ncbi:MAG: hypothetical protein KDD13_00375 [Mangrovimonas sp.]|nr:hypothetical protein [Mangrovimonas sp.]
MINFSPESIGCALAFLGAGVLIIRNLILVAKAKKLKREKQILEQENSLLYIVNDHEREASDALINAQNIVDKERGLYDQKAKQAKSFNDMLDIFTDIVRKAKTNIEGD